MGFLAAGVSLIALLSFFAPVEGHGHKCIHSKVARRNNAFGRHGAGEQPYALATDANGNRRFLQANSWLPIRITPEYTNTVATQAYTNAKALFEQGITRFEQTLSVRRVTGTLQAHRACVKFDESYTPAKCAGYLSETSVTVPAMTDDAPDYIIPSSKLAADELVTVSASGQKTVSQLPAGGGGWADTDLVLLVSYLQTSYCSDGTIAYASSFQRDQFDRPVFGQINLCPAGIADLASDPESVIGVIMHEITHVMVMDASLFPLFRYKDAGATPRTPRDPLYPFLPAPQYNRIFTCDGQQFLSYIPANTTMQWVNERGMTCSYRNATHSGDCVMRIVTPAVRQAARAFFGCSDLIGAELENWDTSECSVVGSHFEARSNWADMMNPYSTGLLQGFTLISLAIYDDSGWYQVDYTQAGTLSPSFNTRVGTTFGYKQGCGFARDSRCLTTSSGVTSGIGSPAHYFTQTMDTQKWQCRLDRKGYGSVGVYDYSANLDAQYRYFPSFPKRGGGNEQLDFCPVMMPDYSISGLNDGLCTTNLAYSGMVTADKNRGMRYGSNSVCLTTTLYKSSLSNPLTNVVGCYQWQCLSASTATVTISDSTGTTTVTGTCATNNQVLTFAGYTGSITCPDPASLCSDRLAAISADVASMNLAAVAAEQQTPGPVQAIVPVAPSRLPSYAPQTRVVTSGGSDFFPMAAWIGIVAAVLAIGLIGSVVSYFLRRRRMAARRQQQQQAQQGQGGVQQLQMAPYRQPAPVILQGIPVGGPMPPAYPGAVQVAPQPGYAYPQNPYPSNPYPPQQPPVSPQQMQMQQAGYANPGMGTYYPQPMAPPMPNAATGYSSYPPAAMPMSMDPMPISNNGPTVAQMPGGRPTQAGSAPVMAPLGLSPNNGNGNRPPPYNPASPPNHGPGGGYSV